MQVTASVEASDAARKRMEAKFAELDRDGLTAGTGAYFGSQEYKDLVVESMRADVAASRVIQKDYWNTSRVHDCATGCGCLIGCLSRFDPFLPPANPLSGWGHHEAAELIGVPDGLARCMDTAFENVASSGGWFRVFAIDCLSAIPVGAKIADLDQLAAAEKLPSEFLDLLRSQS